MSEQRKHIEVVAAIIKKDNTILAAQRGYGDLKDGWEFPGGKIEPGEPHEVALIREIKEELELILIFRAYYYYRIYRL
ncbi:MAG: NUDIX domain-containing protein [Veillonella parvula]